MRFVEILTHLKMIARVEECINDRVEDNIIGNVQCNHIHNNTIL